MIGLDGSQRFHKAYTERLQHIRRPWPRLRETRRPH